MRLDFARKKKRKKGNNEAIGSARKVASRKGCPPDLMQPRFNDRASRKEGGGGEGGMEKLSKASTCIEDNYIARFRRNGMTRKDN